MINFINSLKRNNSEKSFIHCLIVLVFPRLIFVNLRILEIFATSSYAVAQVVQPFGDIKLRFQVKFAKK